METVRTVTRKGDGKGQAWPALAVAVRPGRHQGDAGVGGGLKQEAQSLLARAGGRGQGAFRLVHDGESQLFDRRRGAVRDHCRTLRAKA
jgi:hypothetical protein